MKRKLYTKSHNLELLKKTGNEQFTAEEHAFVTERESAEIFKSKESLLRAYMSDSASKLSALGFLIEHFKREGFAKILSLGAGPCVFEYLLKCALPKEGVVVATDFNAYFIDKAKLLLPDIIPLKFDFFKDDIGALQKTAGVQFDAAFFLGSAYVMDDPLFIRLFKGLGRIGVKQIIDFHAGYMDTKEVMLTSLRESQALRTILRKPPVGSGYLGKFHGYSRSRGELRRLYKESGVDLAQETSIGPYKYTAICRC